MRERERVGKRDIMTEKTESRKYDVQRRIRDIETVHQTPMHAL